MIGDLWEVRTLPGGLALELRGDPPGLVLVQGSDRVIVELAHVKSVIAAMGNAAAVDRKAECASRPNKRNRRPPGGEHELYTWEEGF